MKTILAGVDGTARDAAVLDTSHLIARAFGGHIECLYVRPDLAQVAVGTMAGAGVPFGIGAIAPEVWELLVAEDRARALAARQAFDAFCERQGVSKAEAAPRSPGVTAAWREETGDAFEVRTRVARFHDLAVLHRSGADAAIAAGEVGEILVGCGRPVLLTRTPAPLAIGATIAIAWKETAEAARAVTAAMPLLARAKRIEVLCVNEKRQDDAGTRQSGESLARELRRHGLEVRPHAIEASARAPAEEIVDAAIRLQCDLLVMGGYGHSRAREFVFGGVTRHVLSDARIPVLLAH